MKNILNLDSPLMNKLRTMADLIILNLLWLLGCLPIITIGASTAALYQAVIKIKNQESISLWVDFWRFFRANFKQATILLGIMAAIVVLTFGGIWIILTQMADFGLFFKLILFIPMLLVSLPLGYVLPLQAQFENSVRSILKNAWIMSWIHFLISAIVLVVNLAPILVFLLHPALFLRFIPVWISLGGALPAYLNTALLQRVFLKYIPTEEVQE